MGPYCWELWIVSCHQLIQLTNLCNCFSNVVYKIDDICTVPVEQLESSVFKASMVVTFTTANATTEVKSVEMCHEELNSSRDDEFQHKEHACQDARHVNGVENGKNDSPVTATGFAERVLSCTTQAKLVVAISLYWFSLRSPDLHVC